MPRADMVGREGDILHGAEWAHRLAGSRSRRLYARGGLPDDSLQQPHPELSQITPKLSSQYACKRLERIVVSTVAAP